jgi:hypothetical protein
MADAKISALDAAAAVTADDLIPIVNDPAGTPATQKATALQVATYVISADAELSALAGLTSAANKLPYFTGSGTAALADLTAAGRALLDDANAAAQLTTLGLTANGASLVTAADYSAMRTLLGLVVGTDVQAQDAELAAIAGLTSAADRLPYFTGSGTAALATFTAAGRALLDDANAAAQLTTLGISAFLQTVLDDADAAAARTTLGAAQAVAQGRAKIGATTYYSIPGVVVTAIATTTVAQDTIRYTPILIPTTVTLDQLAIEVSTASGTGGSTARMGLYNADTDWQPTTLVVDGGTVATDSTGVKTASISQQLSPGRYLLAINASVNVACRAFRSGIPGNTLADSLGGSAFLSNLRVASAYAAFAGTGVVANAASSSSTPMEYVIVCRTSVP